MIAQEGDNTCDRLSGKGPL